MRFHRAAAPRRRAAARSRRRARSSPTTSATWSRASPAPSCSTGSVRDIVDMVRFAGQHGLKLSMNGQSGTPDLRESHSNFGQAQVAGGVAITPPSGLSTTIELPRQRRGGRRRALVRAVRRRRRPGPDAAGADRLHAPVGRGHASAWAGSAGATSRFGTQADNVIALRVMTGTSDRINCSRRRPAGGLPRRWPGWVRPRNHPAGHRPTGPHQDARPGSSTCFTTISPPTSRTSSSCCASCASTTWRGRSCATPATPAGATRSKRPPTSRRPRRPTTPPCWRGLRDAARRGPDQRPPLPGLRLPDRSHRRLHQEHRPLGHAPPLAEPVHPRLAGGRLHRRAGGEPRSPPTSACWSPA